MYYRRDNSISKIKRRRKLWPLAEYAMRAILRHNLRPGPMQLPQELVSALCERRFHAIHPRQNPVQIMKYPHYIVNATAPRLSGIAYAPLQHAYMNLIDSGVGGERTNASSADANRPEPAAVSANSPVATIGLLTREQDRKLNQILLDYVIRTKFSYLDLRENPYVD
jgi:hypothetical protein